MYPIAKVWKQPIYSDMIQSPKQILLHRNFQEQKRDQLIPGHSGPSHASRCE